MECEHNYQFDNQFTTEEVVSGLVCCQRVEYILKKTKLVYICVKCNDLKIIE